MRSHSFFKTLALIMSLFLLGSTTSAFAAKEELHLIDGLENPIPAPLIMGISAWVNSKPIKLSDLKGKVVLIEFWTTSCPYCRRAQPYVNQWYKYYHNKGLLVIGIHTPKTQEERSLALVKESVIHHDIHFPVAVDNDFESWQSFNAEGWPSFYLIDKKGYVVFVSYGAQGYEIIENNIRFLLGLNEEGSKPASEVNS
jgi:thiol-disulfide isomerase/thioredoxin